ncbi:GNAT family N-acetyltransferase [Dermatobacter hominis]|uniref:GNAT family N-acetyltransferase n=1 Tax=Dermatobacter hominis TaxID=2884263 RepID=UPI001D0F9100|nr:GNAT family protein [Dermatobacter hominis]UDY37093.1 GNAT family N-acetyltransferase [Dermatobacter hominis]
MGHPHWPLWDIRIRTPRLELRPIREQEMADLVAVVDAGVHDPATMPFLNPFTDVENPARTRDSYRFWFRNWAEWSTDRWHLPMAVYEGGRCVGTQGVEAQRFPLLRTVSTGSFLGLADQGRGIGREMRAAVLHLAFAGLGAARAVTEAFTDNVASQRVTESLGYRPNGTDVVPRRDGTGVVQRYVLERSDWEPRRRDDVVVEGLSADALDMFGLGVDDDGVGPA